MARRTEKKAAVEAEHPMDQPVSLKTGQIRVTAVGQELIFVENHDGLITYTTEKIVLRSGGGQVVLTGESLMLSHMRQGILRISGLLVQINWQGGGSGVG